MEKVKPLSRNRDEGRTLINLLRADIKDINYYEAKHGTVLGDHFHEKTTEYFFITRGTCLMDVDGKKDLAYKGDLFVIKPGQRHTMECITDISFLTFLTEPFNHGNPDLKK